MLVMSHIGYTLGITSQVQKVIPNKTINQLTVAVMSLLPDIVDRMLFVFVLPFAESGRLFAHTILFGVIICIALTTIRRHWWIYGLAPILHVILDTPMESPLSWMKRVSWPIFGADLQILGVDFKAKSLDIPDQITTRITDLTNAYFEASWWYLSLELGGILILIFFFLTRSRSCSQEKP